jgi:hypothetical protein
VAKRNTLNKNDVARLGKSFGYMISSLSRNNVPEADFVNTGNAVLEHHFDNHEHCGPWCPRKSLSEAQLATSERFYRCKVKDAKLYAVLSESISRFITMEKLQDVAHTMDTCVNESFNNAVSWLAPKNKVYCGSPSLKNRVGMAIGIKSIGTEAYFIRLFKDMGIAVSPNVQHYLRTKGNNRQKRIDKSKTKEQKKLVKNKYFTDLKKEEAAASQARKKRDGTYKSGQNMQGEGDDDDTAKPAAQKKARTSLLAVCPHCGLTGHLRRTSKACLQYSGKAKPAFACGASELENVNGAVNPAEDMMNFDALLVHEEEQQDTDVPVNSDVGVVLVRRDPAMFDSDGEDIYSAPSSRVL